MITKQHTRLINCTCEGSKYGCRVASPLGESGYTRKEQRQALNKRFRKSGKNSLRNEE